MCLYNICTYTYSVWWQRVHHPSASPHVRHRHHWFHYEIFVGCLYLRDFKFRAHCSSRAWYLISYMSKWSFVGSSGPRTCRATRSTGTRYSSPSNRSTWYSVSPTSTTRSSRSAPPPKVSAPPHTQLVTEKTLRFVHVMPSVISGYLYL